MDCGGDDRSVAVFRRFWGDSIASSSSSSSSSRLRECDEVDGGSSISAKYASSSLSSKILSCVDGDCGMVNSGRGGSGDSPSTGERSGASRALATACLTAVGAVGVGKGGGGSAVPTIVFRPQGLGPWSGRRSLCVRKDTFNGPLTVLAFNWCFYSLIFLVAASVRSFAFLLCDCLLVYCFCVMCLSSIPSGMSAFFWRFFSPCLVFSPQTVSLRREPARCYGSQLAIRYIQKNITDHMVITS